MDFSLDSDKNNFLRGMLLRQRHAHRLSDILIKSMNSNWSCHGASELDISCWTGDARKDGIGGEQVGFLPGLYVSGPRLI